MRVNRRGVCKCNGPCLRGQGWEDYTECDLCFSYKTIKITLHFSLTEILHFWALKTTAIMKDAFSIPRRYPGLSARNKSGGRGGRDVLDSTTDTVCVLQATPWRSSQAAGDCPMPTLHPKYFLRWENYPLAVFQLAFLAIYFHAPHVGNDKAPRERVLCWPLLTGTGNQGTPIRDGDTEQECHNHSLCRAAPMKVNVCCHHLWGQRWPRFSSPINRCPRLTEKRIWLGWILFSIPKRGRQILFPFSLPACNLELVSVGNISGICQKLCRCEPDVLLCHTNHTCTSLQPANPDLIPLKPQTNSSLAKLGKNPNKPGA